MKKSLLLAVVLGSLVACGGSGPTGPTSDPVAPAPAKVTVTFGPGTADCVIVKHYTYFVGCRLTVVQTYTVSGGSATLRDYAFVTPANGMMIAKSWTGDLNKVVSGGGDLTLGPLDFMDPSYVNVTINFSTPSGPVSLTSKITVVVK